MSSPVIVIQPPLVQLNGPYPSGAYLASFFRGLSGEFAPRAEELASRAPIKTPAEARGIEGVAASPCPAEGFAGPVAALVGKGVDPARVRWIDASNGLFRDVFSRAGLSRLFDLSRETAIARADAAERSGDGETAFQLRRFVSTESVWVSWIDAIVDILSGRDRERCHALVRSPHAPRGARIDAFLSGLDADPSPDDARMIATLALEDLADYASAAFDEEFSLVRYAESLASSERSFARVEAALDRPFVAGFIEPYAERLWDDLERGVLSGNGAAAGEPFLLCLTVPFPGALVGALAFARSARRRFGSRVAISMGGGYVSTELRGAVNPALARYVDLLSFDRGFGGYAALLSGDGAGLSPGEPARLMCPVGYEGYERRVTENVVPDYSDVDFSRYPRLADDPNPMHRLWSDGAWLKAYLAHGCYWHRCSFCDVSLDYVAGYRPVRVARLYAGLRAQAAASGVRGVHLVDEAAPPRALRDFARENLLAAREGRDSPGLLSFWGNIRFERTFTRDLADFLAAGGLLGVSGGIEIASSEGFASVGKGIDLENLVASCAAFKEAGILVHAYLIYGYWDEDAQGVIDSAETMRQLFRAGLVDSAFWHKFVLTRHSRVYGEWVRGLHRSGPALEPVDEAGDFADNDLRFAGERDSDRYGAPLDAALRAWMAGESLDRPVRSWFPFPVPSPRVSRDCIDGLVEKYEAGRDRERTRPCEPGARYWWTASRPVASGGSAKGGPGASRARGKSAVDLVWWHLGEEVSLSVEATALDDLFRGLGYAESAGSAGGDGTRGQSPGEADPAALARLDSGVFRALRSNGLARISPLGSSS